MKLFPAVISAVLTALHGLASGTPQPPPAAVVEPPGRGIEVLIRELSDESYRVRENADREIWRMGETALPALKEAVASPDPEQAYRARDLLRKIQLHITSDTDPMVISLVEQYVKASIKEKTTLLAKMKIRRAWRQMLKLYASETRAEVRAKLLPSIEGVAVKAARERLVQGDAQAAREYLEMAPVNADDLIALAEFHRSHGTLEAELGRAKAGKDRKSLAWQLALQRAAGNFEAARDAAIAAGEPKIAAAMAAFAGDPLPWLGDIQGHSADDRNKENSVSAAYAAVATKRWQRQSIRPADLEPITRALAARDYSERSAAVNALFLLGEVSIAEPAFVKADPLSAFQYFESQERIPEALKALGIDLDHPDYKVWVEKRIEKLVEDDVEDQHGVSTQREELVLLANFFESRGLDEESFDAFSGSLVMLAGKDIDSFVNFLRDLFGSSESKSGASQLAKRVGIAWAGEDEKRWGELIVAAFGDDDHSSGWWKWLAELDPKASRIERFDGMLSLFGIGADPGKLRDKWLALAWQVVDKTPVGQRDELVGRIATLSFQADDVANSLRAWKQLPESARGQTFWGLNIIHLSAAERWNDAAEVILKQIAAITTAKQEVSADLHAYAAAALRRAGREADAIIQDGWADQLALGNAATAIRIGNGYAYGYDYERAAAWWARAAREANPDSSEFILATKLHSDILLEQGKWKEAASTSEVIARQYTSPDFRESNPLPMMRQRLQADMARAFSELKTDRSRSIGVLAKCHQMFMSDGSLADFFFPSLRKAGLIKEHDEWFRATWDQMKKTIARYPESHNTRNTAAWFAARALRKLDEAEKYLAKALAANPRQSAFLDTMAEIQFARGNRAKALEWSKIAINCSPDDSQLRRQQERFRSEPLPK